MIIYLFLGVKAGELIYSLINKVLPEGLQHMINQYILKNTQDYNKTDYPFAIDNLNIFTPNDKPNPSVYAIDHMKYGGLERYFDTERIEKAISLSKTTILKNELI